jgi:anti-sigma regulatory factor (Ser/Thr protein kinase)
MDLLLCLGESVNNAIKHGYLDRQTQGKVQIWVLFFSDRVVVAVEDFGAGFNEEKILCKAMQAPENIAGLSGRGIFIINSLMDNAIHRSNEESSSTSIFIKFLQIKSDAHILEQAREV